MNRFIVTIELGDKQYEFCSYSTEKLIEELNKTIPVDVRCLAVLRGTDASYPAGKKIKFYLVKETLQHLDCTCNVISKELGAETVFKHKAYGVTVKSEKGFDSFVDAMNEYLSSKDSTNIKFLVY